jgi:hypothetical protein
MAGRITEADSSSVRKFLVVVLVILLAAIGLAFYFKATTPRTGGGVRVPLTPAQHELLASIPASADTFALVPAAGMVRAKLAANPITRKALEDLAENEQVPSAWMLGGGDLAVWHSGSQTSFTAHLDPLRAAIVRIYVMFGGRDILNPAAGEPLGSQRLDQLLAAGNGLEPGDALVVQQDRSRGTFPPIGRPAVTMVKIGADDITLHSVAPWSDARPRASSAAEVGRGFTRFPKNALASATFTEPPRIVGDLDRLFLMRLSHLLDNGGSIVIYDVNAGTLLPRPDGVIIARDTPENRQTIEKISDAVKTFGEISEAGGEIHVALDHDSPKKLAADTFIEAQWPSNDWSVRIDPRRAAPILDRLSDNAGFRLAASRLYRSSRDLQRWIGYLSQAESIEAAHSIAGATEELRVRVASK